MRPEGLENAPSFLQSCARRYARGAELAASVARVLGPTPVAEKAASVATLWLTALGRRALCAAETTAQGAAAVRSLRTHRTHTQITCE